MQPGKTQDFGPHLISLIPYVWDNSLGCCWDWLWLEWRMMGNAFRSSLYTIVGVIWHVIVYTITTTPCFWLCLAECHQITPTLPQRSLCTQPCELALDLVNPLNQTSGAAVNLKTCADNLKYEWFSLPYNTQIKKSIAQMRHRPIPSNAHGVTWRLT